MSFSYDTILMLTYAMSALIYGAGILCVIAAARKLPKLSIWWLLPVFLLVSNATVAYLRNAELKRYASYADGRVFSSILLGSEANPDGLEFLTQRSYSDLDCHRLCQELLIERHVGFVTMRLKTQVHDSKRTYVYLPTQDCVISAEQGGAHCIIESSTIISSNVQIIENDELDWGVDFLDVTVRSGFRYGVLIRRRAGTKPELPASIIAIHGVGYHQYPNIPLLVNPTRYGYLKFEPEVWFRTIPSHDWTDENYVPLFEDLRIRDREDREADNNARGRAFSDRYYQVLNEALSVELDGVIVPQGGG